MICPTCGRDNLPGKEHCGSCLLDLTQLDRPIAQDKIERSLMEDSVRLLRPRRPVVLSLDATVKQAIALLADANVGALLIIDEAGRPLGILSERDLMTRVAGIHLDLDQVCVEQVMTPNPESVTSDDPLAFALRKMDVGGYRHLPVVESGRAVGVISVRDMLSHITRLCR